MKKIFKILTLLVFVTSLNSCKKIIEAVFKTELVKTFSTKDANGILVATNHYYYDSKNRIVKDSVVYPSFGIKQAVKYNYTANQINITKTTYDNNKAPITVNSTMAINAKGLAVGFNFDSENYALNAGNNSPNTITYISTSYGKNISSGLGYSKYEYFNKRNTLNYVNFGHKELGAGPNANCLTQKSDAGLRHVQSGYVFDDKDRITSYKVELFTGNTKNSTNTFEITYY